MNRNIKRYLPVAALAALLFLIVPTGRLLPQFLLDDSREPEKTEPEKTPANQYPAHLAYNIKAAVIPSIYNAIMVTWEMDAGYNDDFIIARSSQVIDSKEKALRAQTVRLVSSREKGVVIDANLSQGVYFYAVIANRKMKEDPLDLRENVNFTSVPVVVAPPQEKKVRAEVTGIKTRLLNDTLAIITWRQIPDKGFSYTVYRSTAILDSPERLKKAEKVGIVSDTSQYLDQSLLKEGTYYYAVTFAYLAGEENMMLNAGENYTTEGLYTRGETVKAPDYYKILSIRAVVRRDNVIISWDYSGKNGNRYFRLYRATRSITKIDEIKAEDVVEDVDITLGSYIDRGVGTGAWYYGIAPYEDSEYREFQVTAGINILRSPVDVAGVKKAEPEHEESLVPIIPDKMEDNHKSDEELHESGSLDDLLRKTFFAGEYKYAIKELQRLVKTTDNEKDRAKARLFIGRSYIELKQYNEALKYLVLKDVEKLYPDEALFWREFALLRLK